MKHKLLSTLALACAMFTSASAFAWDAPTAPSLPAMPSFSGNFVAPEEGNSYYIYNVGTGQFLGCGLDWGTRAVTTNEALVTLDGSQWNVGTNKNAIVPFLLTHPDPIADGVDENLAETWMIQNLNTNKAELYLCHEGNAAWFDGDAGRRNTDNNGFWTIAQVGSSYELIPLDGQEGNTIIYGVHLTNLAGVNYAYTWTDLKNDANTAGLWKFVSTDDDADIQTYIEDVASTTADRQAAFNDYNAAVNVYNARLALYEALQDADKYGVDATAAGAVYTNTSATIDELNAAREALQPAINTAALDKLIKESSVDSPVDITNYILVNPNFDAGNTNGWNVGFISGQNATNVGYQGASYTNDSDPDNIITISKFIEAWRSGNTPLGDGELSQKMGGLPAGRYRLECDGIAVNQGNPSADTEGVYLFYKTIDGKLTIHSESSLNTGNAIPEHLTFEFDYDGKDSIYIGLMTQSTTANWLAADNFQLFAIGAMQEIPAYKSLKDAVNRAEAIDFTDKKVSDGVKQGFEEALSTAQTLVNQAPDANKAEEYSEANENLEAAMKAVSDSEAAFAEIKNILDKIADKIAKAGDNEGWDDLIISLEDLEEELNDKYENNTATVEDAKQAQTDFQNAIFSFLEEGKVKAGDDLTLLLENPDFSDKLNGWTIANRNGGNFGTSFDGVDYAEIECWHGTFDVYQVIPNMPAGVYTITVQGFTRNDDASQASTVELYAGQNTALFMDIEAEYSLEQLYSVGGNFDDVEFIAGNGDTGYKPGGMASAQQFFMRENPMTGKPFYTNEVTITMAEAGDLRIGVRGNDTHSWVLWDNFHLQYAGNDVALYYGLIDQAYEKLEAEMSDPTAVITEDAQATYDDLSGKVANKNNIETGDEALALISAIEDAVAIVKADTKIGNELASLAEFYQSRTAEIISSDPILPEMAATLMDNALTPGYFKNSAAIVKATEELEAAWAVYVFYDAKTEATVDNPYDVTGIIYNNDYVDPKTQQNSSNGWTIEIVGGAATPNYGELECYNNDTINVYQTLSGLLPGYYRVELQGFYRACLPGEYTDSLAQVRNVTIYGQSSEGPAGVEMKNAIDGALDMVLGTGDESEITTLTPAEGQEPTPVYIPNNMEAAKAYLDNEFYPNEFEIQVGENGELTIGVYKTSHVNGDWTIFTNWALYYYGTEAPDAINTVSATTKAGALKVYSIDGAQRNGLRRGINIVKMTDGSVRKVLVK